MRTPLNLRGRVFGRLTVIEPTGLRIRKLVEWRCRCSCGNECIALSGYLTSGQRRSCGCFKEEARRTIKGRYRSLTHYSWRAMMARCYDPGSIGFKNWGGRGIRVCERWLDFNNFITDMGERPSRAHTIERIDNNGHYEPNNCRWATRTEQSRNQKRNIMLTHKGVTRCVMEWSETVGIDAKVIYARIGRGWTSERALTEAVRAY